MKTKKYTFWGIQCPKEDPRHGTKYEVWWLSDSPHNAWMSFFTYPSNDGNLNSYRLPLADAIRAYEAIGYKAVKLEFTLDDPTKEEQMPKVKIYNTGKGIMPKYQRFGDAGFDLHSAEEKVIEPHSTSIIDTGLVFMIPNGYEMQIRSRSGLAAKWDVFVLNSPGTIDCGYRDTVKVILRNEGNTPITIKYFDRIAQGVIKPIIEAELVEVEEVDYENDRGGGLGSTGV
jgi:dUTP pyrophosphatase